MIFGFWAARQNKNIDHHRLAQLTLEQRAGRHGPRLFSMLTAIDFRVMV